MNELISVIVPIYNKEKEIERCLNSLVMQSYRNLHIILINDGSKDDTYTKITPYLKDLRIEYIYQENQGVAGARNTGLKAVKGKYIGFVDPDDYVEPSFFEDLYNNLITNQSQISVCSYFIEKQHSSKRAELPSGCLQTNEAVNALLLNSNMPSFLWNKLYKKELWENIHFPDGKRFEDVRVLFKVFMQANITSVFSSCLYHYCTNDASITAETTYNNYEEYLSSINDRAKDLEGSKYYAAALAGNFKSVRRLIYEQIINRKNYDKDLYSLSNKLFREGKKELSKSDLISGYLFCFSPKLYTKLRNRIGE